MLQHGKVTSGGIQQQKAVSNTVQESDRKDGYNDVNVEKFLVALKSRMVTSTKELATTTREMAKESYVTMASFDSPSISSEILVARKKRVYKLMDYFRNEKTEHYNQLLIDSEEYISIMSSEVSGAVESTVADLIMKELFSACQLSLAENSFMKSVTTSASNVVLNCERVHKSIGGNKEQH